MQWCAGLFSEQNMNCSNEDKTIEKEVLLDLIDQINWCLSQYSLEQETPQEMEQSFQPKWSAFRTLQHNLYRFLSPPKSGQAVAISTLLINVFSRVFSDLCTDTPWDKGELINSARKQTHQVLLKLLSDFEKALKKNDEYVDEGLWSAFRDFENEYNKVLFLVNEEDMKAINDMVLQPS